MQRAYLLPSLFLLALACALTAASQLGTAVLRTAGTVVAVEAVAKPANRFINTAMLSRRMPLGVANKVVPVLSFGRKGYVGAIQVAGAAPLVNRAKAVLQLEFEFDGGRYRIKELLPTDSLNPFGAKRIPGLGATAMLDIAITGGTCSAPRSGSLRISDVIVGGGIGLAVKEFGPQIDRFINSVARNRGGLPLGETKVVPYLSFGEKAYIGAMQVAGPSDRVRRVKAVWQYEDLFDRGRVRVRALVPTDSINPIGMKRVTGVGVTAVIDTVFIRTREARTHPGEYRYFDRYPVFVGDQPPGWSRGRKEGWIKHGGRDLPPGLRKKRQREDRILWLPGRKPKPEDQDDQDQGDRRGHRRQEDD